jgi:signal transduction histidine kinase
LHRDVAGDRAIRRRVRALRKDLAEFSDDLQAIAYELHSLVLQRQGLRTALEQEILVCLHRAGLRVTLNFDPACERVTGDVAICIYRVVQEALRNTIEHSGASRATIEVRRLPNAVTLLVQDFGKGFEVPADGSRRGLGIVSMSERAHLLNGTFSLESSIKGGTQIRVEIPIHEA